MSSAVINIVGAFSAEVLCSVEMDIENEDVVDLKCEVERALGIPEAQQRLLVGGQVLRNHEELFPILGGGQKVPNVSLVRISAEWAKTLQACERGELKLNEMSEDSRADKELVLAAFRRPGNAVAGRQGGLALVAKVLRGDPEVVLAAVACNGQSLALAAEKLRADRDVVLAAVKHDGHALVHASKKLQWDREIVLAAVGQNGFVLERLPANLRADREVAQVAVHGCGLALEFVADPLKSDWDIVADAMRENISFIKFAAEELKNSTEFHKYAAERASKDPWPFL